MSDCRHAAAWASSLVAKQDGLQPRLATGGSDGSSRRPAQQPRPPHLTWCPPQTAGWVCGALLRLEQCETPHQYSQGTRLPAQTNVQAGEVPWQRVEAEPSTTVHVSGVCHVREACRDLCSVCRTHQAALHLDTRAEADEAQLAWPPRACTCGAMGRWKLSSRPCCSSAEAAVVRRSPTMARSSAWPRQRVYSSRLSGTGSKGSGGGKWRRRRRQGTCR